MIIDIIGIVEFIRRENEEKERNIGRIEFEECQYFSGRGNEFIKKIKKVQVERQEIELLSGKEQLEG